MSDYISREAVLMQLCNRHCATDPAECLFKITHNGDPGCFTADDILKIPAADVRPVWIPVTERLPIPEQNVLICTKRGTICVAMYEDGTMRENDSSWSWYEIEWAGWDEEEDCGIIPEGWWEHTSFHPDCEFDCPVDEPVTHWMPLPEPPEGRC